MIGNNLCVQDSVVMLAGALSGSRQAAAHLTARGARIVAVPSPQAGLDALERANLLVICDSTPQRFHALRAAAKLRGLPVIELEPAAAHGSITLVGGGPGAMDLLTLAAVKALAQADVVFVDRLGPADMVPVLAPQASIVDVGKRPGHHKLPQTQIEEQMISAAREGLQVIRLKGGDPFVFGRGFEEMASATRAGIPVSVIPGLSSCITVPAAAGIPVTARGVNRVFSVISGHDPLEESQLTQLTGLGGTIVILMGMGTLEMTVAGFLAHGMSPDMPCAIVESGTTGSQRTTHATLASLARTARVRGCRNPAVIVIGEVAALPQTLAVNDLAHLEVVA